jgi:hypothetical protein
MAKNLQIVFSRFPEHVSDEEFNEWYEAHLDEILSIPGFVSAQRFRLEPVVVDDAAGGIRYRYLALYEVDASPEELRAAMESLNLGTTDSYRARKDAGDDGPELPLWWSEVTFASWNCLSIGERVMAASA